MVGLVEQDEVEVILGEGSEPGIILALDLLDVGDDYVRVVEVIPVRLCPANLRQLRERRVEENLALLVEHRRL